MTAQPTDKSLTQWQLIARRFAKHRLAMISFFVIIFLYTIAIGADFFAPYGPNSKSMERIYSPPQLPMFSFADGLYTQRMQKFREPETRKVVYVETQERLPLGFFVKGEPYHMWGVIPGDRHLFGVDRAAWEKLHPGEAAPAFYILGGDQYGHDIFSRLLFGARISLSIGIISIVVTFCIGLLMGGISGYFGGTTDLVIQRIIEIIMALPQLPLWIAMSALVPVSWSPLQVYFAITILLSLLNWPGLARVIRGKILALREEDYCTAARLMGANQPRIILVHLLPGTASHVIVTLTLAVPMMILGETSLSFLNLGLRPPVISWGVMLQDCMDIQALENYPWILLPVLFVVATVLSFNFMGDGLRDAADPYGGK